MKDKSIQNKYQIIRTLGKNKFSETFLAKNKGQFFGGRYVIKKFRPILGNAQATQIRRLLRQEAKILKRLDAHPQIPQLVDSFVDGTNFYLVREWIGGITLEQKVKRDGVSSEAETKQILDSILKVLKYIHGYGIVYRQLKPSSILLHQRNWLHSRQEQNYLPIPIYFGGVKELEKEPEKLPLAGAAIALHREYLSPEQELGKSLYASDIYSLGLTAIYLLTGKTPAELSTDASGKLLWRQKSIELKTNLARVIDRAISPEPGDRFTSAESMLQALHSQPVLFSRSVVNVPAKSLITPEVKVTSALFMVGLGTMGTAFALSNLNFAWFTEQDKQNEIEQTKIEPNKMEKIASKIEKMPETFHSLVNPQPSSKSSESLAVPVFPVGTNREKVLASLGEPTMSSKGYWGMSWAFSYVNYAPERFSLGYLSDERTEKVRQTEITFVESTDLMTIHQTVRELLLDEYTLEIEHQLDRVFERSSDAQEFEGKKLRGIIQRNSQNGIYVGVWDKDFH